MTARALLVLATTLLLGCDDGTGGATPEGSWEVWPTKRSEVLAVADPGLDTIFIFGGNDGPIVNQRPMGAFRKDTWLFHPDVGWREVVTEDQPKKRGRYAASLDPDDHQIYFFGGRFRRDGETGDYRLYNDLWRFDLQTGTWELLDDGSGDGPAGRYYPASAYDAETDTFYLWGGATNESPLIIEPSDELWSWTADEGWTELSVMGEQPSQRMFFGSTHDTQRNAIVLFGGQVGDFSSLAYDQLYRLDLDDLTWEELHPGGGDNPSTRMHGMITYDAPRDRYVMFGGHTDFGDDNDLWVFPGDGTSWELVYEADRIVGDGFGCLGNPSEVPADYVEQDLTAPERRHRGMVAPLHDDLWIFGGMHSECSDHLDDTWRYDFLTDTWHEVIEATSGESCARRNDDCECLCL